MRTSDIEKSRKKLPDVLVASWNWFCPILWVSSVFHLSRPSYIVFPCSPFAPSFASYQRRSSSTLAGPPFLGGGFAPSPLPCEHRAHLPFLPPFLFPSALLIIFFRSLYHAHRLALPSLLVGGVASLPRLYPFSALYTFFPPTRFFPLHLFLFLSGN